ncbi:MAG: DMT family transporter [Planctomycetes bacterium]|nr:DMT family transporter [Planctomycetota bacterium]
MIAPTLASLAALGAAFTWALGSLLFARTLAYAPAAAEHPAGERHPLAPAAANLAKNLLAFAAFAVWAWASGDALPPIAAWPRLLGSGALGFALGDTLYFAALPRIGVQKSAMLGELNVPLTAALSFCFLGERFAPVLLAAMALVLLGVTLVVVEAPAQSSDARAMPRVLRVGVACAALAALFQSLGALVGHAGMEGASVLGGTLVRMAGGLFSAVLVAPLSAAFTRTSVRVELARLVRPFHDRSTWKPLAVAALFGAVFGLPLFHFALRELDPGRGMVLFATTPLFTLPLSRAIGERHGARAWFGTLLGFAGVAWVVWIVHA